MTAQRLLKQRHPDAVMVDMSRGKRHHVMIKFPRREVHIKWESGRKAEFWSEVMMVIRKEEG